MSLFTNCCMAPTIGTGPISEASVEVTDNELSSHRDQLVESRDTDTLSLLSRVDGQSQSRFTTSRWSPFTFSRRQVPHERRRRRRRLISVTRCKRSENNPFSAVCNMLAIVLLSAALAGLPWFSLQGGSCHNNVPAVVDELAISQFFSIGHFIFTDGRQYSYQYGPSPENVLVNCVTPASIQILRSIVALSLVGIGFSFCAFLLDLAGPGNVSLKFVHRNAILSILTILVCITVNGFAYWVSSLLQSLLASTALHPGAKQSVEFCAGFYLVTAAGTASVVATACNLLRPYVTRAAATPPHDSRRHIRDDYDCAPSLGACPNGASPIHLGLPPPPVYTP